MSDQVHNERTKLLANLLNTCASGMFVTGVVAPAVAVLYGVPGPAQATPSLIAFGSLSWFVGTVGAHLLARLVLGRLR
jgi:hypothetical protein